VKATDPRSAYRLQRILDLLLEQDLDQKQLATRLCMADPRQVPKYLNYLCGKNQAHVCGWRPSGPNGHRWPIWRLGKGVSVPKPAPKTNAQLMREHWKRQGRGRGKTVIPAACPFGALFSLQERRA
jgi:hypothetical protein